MAEITVEESWRQIRTLTDRAEQAMADGRPDETADRWRAVLANPCAHHQLAAYEILNEIHRAYREAGHYEDAIAAKLRRSRPATDRCPTRRRTSPSASWTQGGSRR